MSTAQSSTQSPYTMPTATLLPLEEAVLRTTTLPLVGLDDSVARQIKANAEAAYTRLGFPTRRQEAWKYLNMAELGQQAWQLAQPMEGSAQVPLQQAGHAVQFGGPKLVFGNGFYRAEESRPHPSLSLIATATDAAKQRVAQRLAAFTADDALMAINSSLAAEGAVLYLQTNETLSQPAVIQLMAAGADGPTWSHTQHVFVLEANAKATVLVQVLGLPTVRRALRMLTTNLHVKLGDNARLDLVILHDDALANSFAFTGLEADLADGSQLNVSTVAFGRGTARLHLATRLNGDTARVRHHGLSVLQDDSQSFTHSEIIHAVPNTTSDQLVKAILHNATRHDFDGTIVVADDAQLTDAAQLCKTLLLSDQARTFARPQLRIDADDVKCSHGATVGQLNDEELFYLASRGLPKEAAQCLLTFGFAEDALDLVTHKPMAQYLNHQLLGALGQTENPLACDLECTTTCKPLSTPDDIFAEVRSAC